MDEDKFVDEIVGSIVFDINHIINGKYDDKIFWKNIIGCPMGQNPSSAKSEMNNNPELASFWKGRVLLEVVCSKTTTPVV